MGNPREETCWWEMRNNEVNFRYDKLKMTMGHESKNFQQAIGNTNENQNGGSLERGF